MQTQNNPYSDTEVSTFTSKVVVGFFGALGLVATITVAIAVIVACSINRPTVLSLKEQPTTSAATASTSAATKPVAATLVDQPIQSVVYLSVSPGVKPGADGKLHDAWSQTNFAVHVGQPVKLVINNTDNVPHSINSPAAGVNIVAKPGVHTYTLLVTKTGTFQWFCGYPCDPYSMSHNGYMHGTIVAS